MSLNLITSQWLPVRRHDGSRSIIRPAQILDQLSSNPVLMPDWPRPDLNTATLELLIGLFTLSMASKTIDGWKAQFKSPPTVEAADNALSLFKNAFDLCAEGASFMQDHDDIGEASVPIESLFIDSSGENARKNNSDLMVKRAHYQVLSASSAAIALYALQQFAPAGGAGHRTSMRGGGPLTTLIMPKEADGSEAPLWSLIWANMINNDEGDLSAIKRSNLFPWLAPTITSKNGELLHSQDHKQAHPLQAFFGMPRRIRLNLQPNTQQLKCDLTGQVEELIVTNYATKPNGINYGIWRHPLTPYQKLNSSEIISRKAKANTFNYQNWAAILLDRDRNDDKDPNIISECISHFNNGGPAALLKPAPGQKPQTAKLLAAGWAMSKMTPLDYILSEQPLHLHEEPEIQEEIDHHARGMVIAAETVSRMIIGEIQNAMKSGKDKPGADSTFIENINTSFYQSTDQQFHQLLDEALSVNFDNPEWGIPIMEKWLSSLRQQAFTLFDEYINQDFIDPEKAMQTIEARSNLRNKLYGKGLRQSLGLEKN